MVKLSRLWKEILSDWLINLSAGWTLLFFTFPFAFPPKNNEEIITLTANLTLGILTLLWAKNLRNKKGI